MIHDIQGQVLIISPTALYGPKGSSSLTFSSTPKTHQSSPSFTTHMDSNCPSQHLQDNTLLFGSLLNSTPLFSLVLATCNFHAQPQACIVSTDALILQFVSTTELLPSIATSPRPKTRNNASLGYTPPPPLGGSNGASPGKIQFSTSLLVLHQFVMLAGPFPLLSFPSMLKLTQVNLLCICRGLGNQMAMCHTHSKDEKKGEKTRMKARRGFSYRFQRGY